MEEATIPKAKAAADKIKSKREARPLILPVKTGCFLMRREKGGGRDGQ
jgi:hypothetical protein